MAENNEWYTPKEIITSLGKFDLDPASSMDAFRLNQSADKIYTKEMDGLQQIWDGRIWLNPPYSNPLIQQFMMKMATHNNGIALIFSKIETKWFHDIVLDQATAIKLLYDRIQFLRVDGTKGLQPRNSSMLVAYGKENAEILLHSRLKGKFLNLNNRK